VRLAVRLTPKGGRDGVEGWDLDAAGRPFLKVRVSAPPVEGAANAALAAFVAKTLKRPKSAVRIVSGETSRMKILEIDGVAAEAVDAAFGPAPKP
jgi:uncharacterized protein (TIGR00251 family)